MATKLDKAVIRESTEVVDDRNIIISITEGQKISMKLKGMKSGAVEIDIKKLYNQLTGNEEEETPKEYKPVSIVTTPKEKTGSGPVINLNEFRAQYLVSADFPLDVKVKLEAITVNLLNNRKG